VPKTIATETVEKWVSVVGRKSNHNELCGVVFIYCVCVHLVSLCTVRVYIQCKTQCCPHGTNYSLSWHEKYSK